MIDKIILLVSENSYIKLGIAAFLPAILGLLLYLLDKRTSFRKVNYWVKQLLFGFAFGIIAIVGTEWGIPMNGAQVNCRDAAVLTSGLMFGAPAGIIAGLIGGIERWFAVAWGIGTYTRVACSVSTIIAGFYAAALRKFMFENKKPGVFISFAVGIVMEVFHLTMVFVTNMSTPDQAMAVVKACSAPMILANGLSVMITSLFLSGVSETKMPQHYYGQSQVRISQTIQRRLLFAVVLAFACTSYFVYQLQNEIAKNQEDTFLKIAIDETVSDMRAEKKLNSRINTITVNRHVGEKGFVIVFDHKLSPLSFPAEYKEKAYDKALKDVFNLEEDTTLPLTVLGENYYCRYRTEKNYKIVSMWPEDEALKTRNIALYVNTYMEILVFAVLFGMIYFLIKRVVVNQIKNVNESLAKITGGDLSEIVSVRSNEEFTSLSNDINSTVDTLKRYIAEASARIDAELEFAKNIQTSALPNVFPAFPKRRDFDIFACMNTAKEVGGDFYDFYMTGNRLNFLIADVSGKGIPAAMFMMRAKTELKSLTEADVPLDDVFTNGNSALCEGNAAGMFVTAWQGSLDLETGKVKFVNAGHNPPLVKRNGKFEYLKSRAGFVLAGMDGVKYKIQELQLEPGDIIYLYTDGVTEATDAHNELYGEERLLNIINSKEFETMDELCKTVKQDVDEFVGEAPQFDDITMVALKYEGGSPVPMIHFDEAEIEDIPQITEFIEGELEKLDCPMKTVIQINVAIDEIYSNIVNHGYKGKKGPATVKFIVKEDPKRVYVRFSDNGVPYNPLTKEDPDITLSAEDRSIGGLGIFMVKKTMDDIKYKYEDGQNVLTIKKILE